MSDDAFSVDDLSGIAVTEVKNVPAMAMYTFKERLSLDTPLRKIFELMHVGVNFTVTLDNGKVYELILKEGRNER